MRRMFYKGKVAQTHHKAAPQLHKVLPSAPPFE